MLRKMMKGDGFFMDFDSDQINVGIQAAKYVGETSQTIWDKIRLAREKRNKDEAINSLEEIITDLLADKHNLIQTCQFYEEQLITQTMKEEDIEYISEKIIPLLEHLIDQDDDNDKEKYIETIEQIKPILSKETFKIMQLLGFSFKKAFGEPLTELARNAILSRIPSLDKSTEYKMLITQREIEYLKVAQDKEAYERLMELFGKSSD